MKLKNRRITKITFGGAKGVTVHYTGTADKNVPETGTRTIGADPFDSLKKAAEKLRAHFIKVTGLNSFNYMLGSDAVVKIMDTNKANSFSKQVATKQAKQVEITGLTLAWEGDELKRTKLLSWYTNEKGDGTSINSPLVHLDRTDYYGIEEELQRDILALVKEVESFLNGDYTILEEPEEETKDEDPGDEQEEGEEPEDEFEVDFGEEQVDKKKADKPKTKTVLKVAKTPKRRNAA